MNIETANRLLQYRKKKNLSQEELAEKIGVSRQAVSKWERAEASPDTDNLIELAKIYGVTLDELISGSEDKKTGSRNTSESSDDSETCREHISFKNGIHVHSADGDKVDIRLGNINVHDKNGDKVHIGFDGIYIEEKGKSKVFTNQDGEVIINDDTDLFEHNRQIFHKIPFAPVVFILYLLFGFFNICGGWAAGWIIFFTIPLYYTLIDAIYKRNANHFAFPFLAVGVYLWLGMFYSLWHPYWIIIFTIPLYYCITDILKNKK